MREYDVVGMSCAACSARVERAVRGLDGVSYCSVNLLTGTMRVEGLDDESVIAAVTAAGYAAFVKNAAESNANKSDAAKREIKRLLMRAVSSIFILLPLMYISMGYVMWNFPLPSLISQSPITVALIRVDPNSTPK